MKPHLIAACLSLAPALLAAQSQIDRVPVRPPVAQPASRALSPEEIAPARPQTDAKSKATSTASTSFGGPGRSAQPPLPSPEETVRTTSLPVTTPSECQYADSEARADCLAAVRENYRYNVAALQHRRASFEWSLTASEIMFFMVLVMVLAGLVFAAIQFRSSAPTPTDLEISTTGLKVSSSVLGVVILAMSMAFFYVYTRYVYPIQEVHHDTVETAGMPSQ